MKTNTIVWIIVIIVILILGVSLLRTGGTGSDQLSEGTSGLIVGKNAINVNEQPVGNTVRISMVELEKSGFVVIHESANGKPAQMKGASALLPAGISSNVPVTLSAPLLDGKSYIAMLHIDNGDGVFSEGSDAPAKDSFGNNIMMEFDASKDAGIDSSISL